MLIKKKPRTATLIGYKRRQREVVINAVLADRGGGIPMAAKQVWYALLIIFYEKETWTKKPI
jgi:hypothetical protein